MVDVNDDDDGWKELVTDVDAFYNEETQPEVQGRVVSLTQMVLARRDTLVAILSLTKPCKAVKGSGDEKEEVELAPGQTIGVVVKHKLQDLPTMLDNQCEVRIKAKEKVTLDNGNTLWRYSVKFRGQRTGIGAVSAATSSAATSSAAPKAPKDPEKEAKKALEAF